MDELKEMTIKAIEHCKTCQCNGCPFQLRPSYCLAVIEYLIKTKEDKKE